MIDNEIIRFIVDFKIDINDSDIWDSGYYNVPSEEDCPICKDILNKWDNVISELTIDWDNPTEYSYDMIDYISSCYYDCIERICDYNNEYKNIIKQIDDIFDDYDFPFYRSYDQQEFEDRISELLNEKYCM